MRNKLNVITKCTLLGVEIWNIFSTDIDHSVKQFNCKYMSLYLDSNKYKIKNWSYISIVLITVQTGVLMTVQTSVLMTVQTSVLITVQTSVVMTVQTNVLMLYRINL